MASSWSNKLETRLSALADAASRESIQTLAKWIGFNRKHSKAFCTTLDSQFQQAKTESRQWLYFQLVNEVLLLEHGNHAKWDRLSETRNLLGVTVLVPALERMMRSSNSAITVRLTPLMDEWEKLNAFGGPDLVEKMRNILSSPPEEEEVVEVPAPVDVGESAAPKDDLASEAIQEPKEPVELMTEVKEPDTTTDQDKAEEKGARAPSPSNLSLKPSVSADEISLKPSVSTEEVTFDFESSGIPYAKVEAREFLEPCKAIATLQIARDLRNDAAVQLSSRLSAIPEEIQAVCRNAQKEVEETGTALELSAEQARKFAEMIGDDILDVDLDDALLNLKTFVGLVKQQQEARRQLIRLLIQSRCQFGSNDAAELYYSLDDMLKTLKERKHLLSDAMDLEGLDFEADDQADVDDNDKKLEPLEWYEPSEPDAKRARVE